MPKQKESSASRPASAMKCGASGQDVPTVSGKRCTSPKAKPTKEKCRQRIRLPKGSPLSRLVQAYLASQDGFEKGYIGLTTILDFICGKDNKDRKPGEKYLKNWHQRRLKNKTIEDIANKLAVIEGRSFTDFEELLEAVRKENIKYFKHTNSYDFAFRYGLNHGIVPEKYVYIHAGAREGAMSLRRAGFVAFDPKECRIAIEAFPEELRQLSAYHLENFLCVMKKQLAVLPSISKEL